MPLYFVNHKNIMIALVILVTTTIFSKCSLAQGKLRHEGEVSGGAELTGGLEISFVGYDASERIIKDGSLGPIYTKESLLGVVYLIQMKDGEKIRFDAYNAKLGYSKDGYMVLTINGPKPASASTAPGYLSVPINVGHTYSTTEVYRDGQRIHPITPSISPPPYPINPEIISNIETQSLPDTASQYEMIGEIKSTDMPIQRYQFTDTSGEKHSLPIYPVSFDSRVGQRLSFRSDPYKNGFKNMSLTPSIDNVKYEICFFPKDKSLPLLTTVSNRIDISPNKVVFTTTEYTVALIESGGFIVVGGILTVLPGSSISEATQVRRTVMSTSNDCFVEDNINAMSPDFLNIATKMTQADNKSIIEERTQYVEKTSDYNRQTGDKKTVSYLKVGYAKRTLWPSKSVDKDIRFVYKIMPWLIENATTKASLTANIGGTSGLLNIIKYISLDANYEPNIYSFDNKVKGYPQSGMLSDINFEQLIKQDPFMDQETLELVWPEAERTSGPRLVRPGAFSLEKEGSPEQKDSSDKK